MPDGILELVSAAVEIAKENEKKPLRVPGEAKPIPKTVEEFKNIDNDIDEALKPGERYLTPQEAAERRKQLIEMRRQKGLPIT